MRRKTILTLPLFLLLAPSCADEGDTPTESGSSSSSSTGSTSSDPSSGPSTTSPGNTTTGPDPSGSSTASSSTSGGSETGQGDTGSTSDGTGTSTSETGAETSSTEGGGESVCGDGVQADDEACDDGNLEPEDACSNDCEPQFYTGTSAACGAEQAAACDPLGAECRSLLVAGGGGAICYWPEHSGSQNECDLTAGIWTEHDHPFAANNQISIPEPGVCITQVTNIWCSAADEAICDAAGADACFQYKLPNGGNSGSPSLCWWDAGQAECGGTSGIWTPSDSNFAMNNPNSIPPGSVGSCISQVTNLD